MDDYSYTADLQATVASLCGVSASDVTISVKAASVIITAVVAVPATTTMAAVESALSSSFGTVDAATASLMAVDLNGDGGGDGVAVESDPVVTTTIAGGDSFSDSTCSTWTTAFSFSSAVELSPLVHCLGMSDGSFVKLVFDCSSGVSYESRACTDSACSSCVTTEYTLLTHPDGDGLTPTVGECVRVSRTSYDASGAVTLNDEYSTRYSSVSSTYASMTFCGSSPSLPPPSPPPPTAATPTPSPPPPTAATPDAADSSDSSDSGGVIIIAAAGGGGAVALILIGVVVYCLCCKSKKTTKVEPAAFTPNASPPKAAKPAPASTPKASFGSSGSTSQLKKSQTQTIPLAMLAKDAGKQRAAAQLLDAWKISPNDLVFGEKLGEGGQADVFRGTYRGIPVAIKRARGLDTGKQMSDNALRSITQTVRREVRALARVRNPNVIRLYGACMSPTPSVVMALASNGALDDAIREGRFTGVPDQIKVLAGIARGMEAVHMQKLIHLDLKPENVLLGPDNVPWVTDFGLSTSTNLASASTSSAGGRGTLYYKAPELFAYPPVVSNAADVYAYAILSWMVCTGEESAYFGLQSAETAMGAMLAQGVRPSLQGDHDWKDTTAPGLAKLIEACWVTDHEARPAFAGDKGICKQLDALESRLLKKDSDATIETMLERVWAAENEMEVASHLIEEYDAAGKDAKGEAKKELAEEREGLQTTCVVVQESSAAAQQILKAGGHEDLLSQMFAMMKEMNSELMEVKKDVKKGTTTLSSLAVDELYCPRLVFITPYEAKPGLMSRLKKVASEKHRLIFLDPVTGAAAPCGKDGQGYVLKLPSEFLVAHGKQISDGLKIVKLALALGKVTGILPPGAGNGMPTEVISKAEAHAVHQFEMLLSAAEEERNNLSNLSEETVSAAPAKSRRKSSTSRSSSADRRVTATDNAYRALASLVESQCDDPNLTLCHMSKVVAGDGSVEWVTEASKARFEAEGAECLIWNQKDMNNA